MRVCDRRLFEGLVFFTVGLGSLQLAAATTALDSRAYVEPLPSVRTYAATHQLALSHIEVSSNRETRIGDSVTALLTFWQGARYRQWLIQSTTQELTAEERRLHAPQPWTLFTNVGTALVFGSGRLALNLRIIGPFRERDEVGSMPPSDKRARALVDADFLGLGFDHGCRALLKMAQATNGDRAKSFVFRWSREPFAKETTDRLRSIADTLGMTREDERALAGTSPALFGFLDVTQKTPGLRDILSDLLGRATIAWSLFTHGGKLDPSFHINGDGIEIKNTPLPDSSLSSAYLLPFNVALNEKPALTCNLLVTAPHPPLLASAGVVLAVIQPATDATKRIIIRVLAARPASIDSNAG